MLEKMFARKDVCDFIEELFSGNYSIKTADNSINYCDITGVELSFFAFLDALFKYQIIIETDVFLDEYVVQVRKLFKKLDNFHDINLGIAKIIGKLCALKLNISDREEATAKKRIWKYVYDKYIVEGYFFHGFSGVYKDQIRKYGFIPEQYQHSYSKFMEIDKIFSKHKILAVMGKDFSEKYVSFADNFMMGCYYGGNSPMYFYRLLGGSSEIDNCDSGAYFRNDYLGCFSNLNKLIKKAKLNDYEKKYVTKVCYDEWKVLQKGVSHINVMLVKRKVFGLNCLRDINDILNGTGDLGDGIWKIISSKSNDIPINYKLQSSDIEFIEVPNYKVLFELREKQAFDAITKSKVMQNEDDMLNNSYGKVSILILLGSLFIAFGVILTIITISKGM